MHRFKFTEKGAQRCTLYTCVYRVTLARIHTHTNAHTHNLFDNVYRRAHRIVCTCMANADAGWYWTHLVISFAHFIEIENYEKHHTYFFRKYCLIDFFASLVFANCRKVYFVPFYHSVSTFILTSISELAHKQTSHLFRLNMEMNYVQRTLCALWILFIVLITLVGYFCVVIQLPTNAFNYY